MRVNYIEDIKNDGDLRIDSYILKAVSGLPMFSNLLYDQFGQHNIGIKKIVDLKGASRRFLTDTVACDIKQEIYYATRMLEIAKKNLLESERSTFQTEETGKLVVNHSTRQERQDNIEKLEVKLAKLN